MAKFKNNPDEFYRKFLDTVEKCMPENYFQNHLSENKKFDLFENEQFQELFRHSPAIVGVFNNVLLGYEFLSDNIETITGHSPELFMGPNGMEEVIATFPLEHGIIYTNKIFPTLYGYFQQHASSQDIKEFRFTASFQLIKKDKSVIWCMQQLSVIETNDEGFPLLILLFMSDITHIKKDKDVDFVVAQKDQNHVFQNIYVAAYPTQELCVDFTRRELEILTLLGKGKSSNQIADLLSISENTVNTHRQNMLEKSSKKNTAELLSYAITKGYVK
ncbi:MAG TPA: LuxR C-terminal-related transcriptional regulator [Cytophagaceae bacterium]|jgi:DNA-binding CsgD family transcriptional regulator|nr:LuxR C-terminal-related transcriptional regulator [Cytophagaceae bacterium]